MEKELVVEVVDFIMGSGKSHACFEWINNNSHEKFIYVSPILSEVGSEGRIHQEITGVEFISPEVSEYFSTKTEHLTELLSQGSNIACTHNLYLSMTNKHFDIIEQQGYIVLLDEEIDVIKSYGTYSTSDINYLINKGEITVDDKDGLITWIGDDNEVDNLDHKYFKLKNLCDKKSLYLNRGLKAKKNVLISHIPLKLLSSAKRVIVITYMFDGSILDCFLKLKGIKTKPCVDIIPTKQLRPSDFKDLITLIEPNKKVKNIKMSASWWSSLSVKNDEHKKQVASISNFIMNTAKSHGVKASELIYTCPKDNAKYITNEKTLKLNPSGYVRYKNEDDKIEYTWLSVHTRATNNYDDKIMVAHCYSRYPYQPVRVYLETYGYPINLEKFAVASLLQFTWRSRIRKMENIILLIANERMYNLFWNWLNEKPLKETKVLN